MSFGLTVANSSGTIIFDSNTKKYYTLAGKMVARDVPYEFGMIVYINPPSIFNPTNSIFVVKPPQGVNSSGRRAWVGVLPADAVYKLKFSLTDGTIYTSTYPQLEVYVFTTLPLAQSSEYGVEVRDVSGQLSFNTTRDSHTLQITEQINGDVLTGKLNSYPANGAIISASFYQAVASGAGYVRPTLAVFRSDDVNIYSEIHSSGRSIYSAGGFSFTKTSLALVKLPSWQPPVISW